MPKLPVARLASATLKSWLPSIQASTCGPCALKRASKWFGSAKATRLKPSTCGTPFTTFDKVTWAGIPCAATRST
jgi:hypothetical protein